ncbi:polyamine aminopropyltransferase [Pleionea litopenaei]|uniref:Polyamine aminopropyltransferase n=1 Tax=Pleionea litopenaei TaxID=3070815 RepID=A0AA51RU40_9GAMM|nr:polyamine aminopropyltransferase [Pleionea sp. HL-JVS1]WMS87545.1 polyamine aminopropyltransferase [Pleionea sp. HL-JVS1]
MSERYLEVLYPTYGQYFEVKEVLFEHKTDHQHLIIFNNDHFGRVMALDGIIQTTEKDEFIYHEMLTHVPLMAHRSPKSVLIIGGGDGGILRETLRHSNVERVVQVEIDQSVIDMCKEYFPKHSNGAFDDPRAEIVIADGMDYVKQATETFDIIISDSTDPVGPGEVLFTNDFYRLAKARLNDGGIMVTQNGVCYMQLDEVINTTKRMGALYQDQTFYTSAVPTYIGGLMTLAWATDDTTLRQQEVADIRQRFESSGIKTRYYNPELHKAAFALPQYVRDAIDAIK